MGKKCDRQRVRMGTGMCVEPLPRAGFDSKFTLLKRKGRVRLDHPPSTMAVHEGPGTSVTHPPIQAEKQ